MKLPTWRSIAMRLPARSGQPVTFTLNDRERLNPMARSTLTVDATTGAIVRWEPYESLLTGQRQDAAAVGYAVTAIIGSVLIAGGLYLLHRKDADGFFTR